MGKISSGTGEEVSEQSAKQGDEGQNAGNNLDSSISKANQAADSFITDVKGIETKLEAENIQLQNQMVGYELTIKVLLGRVNSLEKELENKSNCGDDDGYAKSKTPEELAGVAPPPLNSNGGPS